MPLPEAGVGPIPEGLDPEEYERRRRRVLWSMPTGLFVVGSRDADRRNLMTANWVMQIATAPKLIAFAVETGSVTRELVESGGGFSVSILPKEARSLVRRFGWWEHRRCSRRLSFGSQRVHLRRFPLRRMGRTALGRWPARKR